MTIRVMREPSALGTTLGVVFVNGRFRCFSLEDEIRPVGVKVDGQTAIPAGRYPVQITYSPKFQRRLPEVQNVPGFSGIRIHPGNTSADTAGCLLLGIQRSGVRILESQTACQQVQYEIEDAQTRGESVWLVLDNPLEDV